MARRRSAEWLGFEALEPRQLLAFVTWDGGGGDLSWHNPLNWSGDVLPGPADHVVIDTAGRPEIRYTDDVETTVASLWSLNPIRISDGALRVTGLWRQAADLTLEGGAIDGPGDLMLYGKLDWLGGTLAGSPTAKLQVLAGSQVNIAGDVTLGRMVVNNGTIFWSAGDILASGAHILNLANRLFLVHADGALLQGAATSVITNYGIIERGGDPLTTTTIAITVNNVREQVVITPGPIIPFPAQPTVSVIPPGTIDVRHGTLSLTGVVVQREGDRLTGGRWLVSSSDATLDLAGPGFLNVMGEVVLNGPGSRFDAVETAIYVSKLTLSGGRENPFASRSFAAGELTVDGSTTFGSLRVDTLRIRAGTTRITGAFNGRTVAIDDGAVLTLAGTAALEYANVSGAGLLRIEGHTRWLSGRIAGPGQMLITSGGTLEIRSVTPWGNVLGTETQYLTRRTVNYGLILWNDPYGGEFRLSAELVNRGTLALESSSLYLGTVTPLGIGAPPEPGMIHNFGTVTVNQNLTLRGAAGGVALVNRGEVLVQGTSRLTLNGGASGGGSWIVDPDAELIFGGLDGALANATISGNGRIRVAHTATWTNVNVSGNGSMIVTAPGHLTFLGSQSTLERASVTNLGYMAIGPSVTVNVKGDFVNQNELFLGVGHLRVTGNLHLASSSVVRVVVAGPIHGSMLAQGTTTLGGSLVAAFLTPPPVGQVIPFLFANGGLTGNFHTLIWNGLNPWTRLHFGFTGTTGSLRVQA